MTTNPLHAILRHSDKTVVATYSPGKEVTKEGIRECVAANANIQSGKRYTSTGDSQAIHYCLDAQGRVYSLVTNPRYSPRIAFLALEELQKQFGKEFGPRVASATEGSLTKPARTILQDIAIRLVVLVNNFINIV